MKCVNCYFVKVMIDCLMCVFGVKYQNTQFNFMESSDGITYCDHAKLCICFE